MKKLMLFVSAVMLVAAFMAPVAFASGSPVVVGTYAYSDLGQGAAGGGALFSDGTASSPVKFSLDNGQVVFMLVRGTWSWLGTEAISFCFDVREIKGPSPYTSFCGVFPVTGTPVMVDGTLFRITINH